MTERRRQRRGWFWRSRSSGAPAVCEETEDGRWRIFIDNVEVGIVTSRTAAEQFVDELDLRARGG